MKLLYVNAIETNAGWGAECFVDRGLRDLGHQTRTLDYRRHRRHLTRRLLDVGDVDALILQRAEHFPLPLVAAVRRPRVFWASELVARRPDQDRLFRSGLFDHVFVRTPACRRTVVRRGWLEEERVSILLSAFDPETHRRLPGVERDIDVLFVGSVTPRRHRILERLARRFDVEVRSAYGAEMVRLFNRARIVLNLHAEEALDTETRVYEALGAGAFLLTERLSEESPFLAGTHLVEAEDLAHLEDRIEHYLRAVDARDEIAAAGHAEAQARHTYLERARQIASALEEARGTRGPWSEPAIDVARVRAFARVEPAVWLGWAAGNLGARLRKRMLSGPFRRTGPTPSR